MTPDSWLWSWQTFPHLNYSYKVNQTAATASNCINCSCTWQSQLKRQHHITQRLLALTPCWPSALASILGTSTLPQAISPNRSAVSAERSLPSRHCSAKKSFRFGFIRGERDTDDKGFLDVARRFLQSYLSIQGFYFRTLNKAAAGTRSSLLLSCLSAVFSSDELVDQV